MINSPRRVHAIFGHPLTQGGVAYTLTEIMDNLGSNIERLVHTPRVIGIDPRSYHKQAFGKLAYKLFSWAERKLNWSEIEMSTFEAALEQVKRGDVVYLWPPYSEELILRCKDQGAIVIAERINCMGETCKERLTRAFGRTGHSLPEGWCEPEAIRDEVRQMRECDFVTAPNAFVRESLEKAGIPDSRILDTSYGFSPTRLQRAVQPRSRKKPPNYLFVGLGNVRKGLDVLLEAWELALPPGNLFIAGEIEPSIKQRYAKTLARSDVHALGYVRDIDLVYAQSDIFVFPTHEEGGPQVIYEAAGCGLACITSPMGQGRLPGDSILSVNPMSVIDVATNMVMLADDRVLLEELATRAHHAAHSGFTWKHVGARFTKIIDNVSQPERARIAGTAGVFAA